MTKKTTSLGSVCKLELCHSERSERKLLCAAKSLVFRSVFRQNPRFFVASLLRMTCKRILHTHPKKLEDGEPYSFFLDYTLALEVARKGATDFKEVFIQDAEGKRYTSKIPKAFRKTSA